MHKYTHLIFDADNTLFDFDKSEEYALEQSFIRFNFPYDSSDHLPVYRRINKKIWREFEEGKISTEELKTERYRRFFREIGAADLVPEEFGRTYLYYLSRASFLYEGVIDLLETFGECELCLVTNGLTAVQRPRFEMSGIGKYFSSIVISEEVGYAKPQPEIFDLAFRKFENPSPEKTLMIGDNLGSDILGAVNYGLDSCWYNPKGRENSTDLTPTYEVRQLKELIPIVFSRS